MSVTEKRNYFTNWLLLSFPKPKAYKHKKIINPRNVISLPIRFFQRLALNFLFQLIFFCNNYQSCFWWFFQFFYATKTFRGFTQWRDVYWLVVKILNFSAVDFPPRKIWTSHCVKPMLCDALFFIFTSVYSVLDAFYFGRAQTLFDCAQALFDLDIVLFDCAHAYFDCAGVLFTLADALF